MNRLNYFLILLSSSAFAQNASWLQNEKATYDKLHFSSHFLHAATMPISYRKNPASYNFWATTVNLYSPFKGIRSSFYPQPIRPNYGEKIERGLVRLNTIPFSEWARRDDYFYELKNRVNE